MVFLSFLVVFVEVVVLKIGVVGVVVINFV